MNNKLRFIALCQKQRPILSYLAILAPTFAVFYPNSGSASLLLSGIALCFSLVTSVMVSAGLFGWSKSEIHHRIGKSVLKSIMQYSRKSVLLSKTQNTDLYDLLAEAILIYRHEPYTKEFRDFKKVSFPTFESIIVAKERSYYERHYKGVEESFNFFEIPNVEDPERLNIALRARMASEGINLKTLSYDLFAASVINPDLEDKYFNNILKLMSYTLNNVPDAVLRDSLTIISSIKSESLVANAAKTIVEGIQNTDNIDTLRNWVVKTHYIPASTLEILDNLQPHITSAPIISEITKDLIEKSKPLGISESLATLKQNFEDLSNNNWDSSKLEELKRLFVPVLSEVSNYVYSKDSSTIKSAMKPQIDNILVQLVEISSQLVEELKAEKIKSLTMQEKMVSRYMKV